MPPKRSFPAALKLARKARGLSQEAFSNVSSRTYLSTLERGMKSPTLKKITDICEELSIHPLTLLTLAYAGTDLSEIASIQAKVRRELEALIKKAARKPASPAT